MPKIERMPSGSYHARVSMGKDQNGKRLYISITKPSKKEVEKAIRALESERNYHKSNNLTLGQAMENYVDNKRHILSPSTIAGYEQIIRLRLPEIQAANLYKLTEEDLQRAINLEALKLSPKTVANISGFLSAVLATYRPGFQYNITIPRKTRKLKELSDPETIMQAVHNTPVELPVLLAMWLTLRMSEIRGLRRCDIKDNILTINQVKLTINGVDVIRTQAKTANSIRRLRLPPYILELIAQLPPEQEYLCPASAASIYKRFSRILETNNLPHMAFHDLRHLAASVMVQLNIPDKYAMERGGWSTDNTLKSVYQHTFSSERQHIDNIIDEYFGNIAEKILHQNIHHDI